MTRPRILPLAVLGGLLLTGCLGSSPESRFYTLTQQPPPTSGDSSQLAVTVGLMEFPTLLARPQIVLRESEHEVRVLEFARWAEPLEDALPRILAGNIGAALGSARVSPVTAGPATPDAYLGVYVQRFDVTVEGPAVLAARWMLLDADRNLLLTGSRSFEAVPTSDDVGAMVAALNQTLGELSAALVADIQASPL